MKALQNIYTALLYGKYESIIVQDSEILRFKGLLFLCVFFEQM